MAFFGASATARAASPTNQAWSSPAGSGSAAPTKCQPPSQTSAQVWLPPRPGQEWMPATRAGIPTARAASTSMIDSPVQVAIPCAIDSRADWSVRSRRVLYVTL